jgi:hypothetical protein
MSCKRLGYNAVRMQLHAPAYSLAHIPRCFELLEDMTYWSPSRVQFKLIKIGARDERRRCALDRDSGPQ